MQTIKRKKKLLRLDPDFISPTKTGSEQILREDAVGEENKRRRKSNATIDRLKKCSRKRS